MVEVNKAYEAVVVEVWERSHSIVKCGDINAHSTLWGTSYTHQNGLVIEVMLDWGDLVCANDGSYTRDDLSQILMF